jgi:glycosyltransferase involved in cell wall biosynthesis
MVSPRPSRPVVLTLLGAFWPGNDASGPNQSFRALASALGDEFEFRLLARDRPFGSIEPAAETGRWIDLDFAKARYCRVGRWGAQELGAILCGTRHDVLWLNGFFDRELTIPALVLRRMGRIPDRPVLLSPRGEFAVGALGLKSAQKRLYIAFTRHAGLLGDVTLHATSEDERLRIEQCLPHAGDIRVAPNVRLLIDPPAASSAHHGDAVRLVFIGRIARVKNLDYALEVLRHVAARVTLDIYGPVQEADYWAACRQLIASLPAHIAVTYRGEIPNDQVPSVLGTADLLFLPTKGENFGHAIFEALSCGVPALISDTTPWRDLEHQAAGWDLPLTEPRRFAAAIDTVAGLDPAEHARLRTGARALAERHGRQADAVNRSRRMLRGLIRQARPVPSGAEAQAVAIMTNPTRLAIVVSHPIQHFVHLYRALAKLPEIRLQVLFCSPIGVRSYFDREMNTDIAWKTDLLGGYDHAFLPEADRIATASSFFDVNNPSVSRVLARFRPNAVMLYGYGHLTMLRALLWCRMHGVPALITGDSELLRSRAAWKSALKRAFLPLLLRQYSGFLTTGDNNEAYYRHYGVTRELMFRAPFTIDEPSFIAARSERGRLREEFRRAHGIEADAIVVLFVGKLYGQKRPRDLLAAAERIRSSEAGSPPVRFVIAGNGPDFDALGAEIAAKQLPVTRLGFVNVDELPRVYCGADILAHPSERDAHPLVIAEAACIGLALVLSDRVGAVGATDIARREENAIVYPCGRVDALAEAIAGLAADPLKMRAMQSASTRIYDELDARRSVAGIMVALDAVFGRSLRSNRGRPDASRPVATLAGARTFPGSATQAERSFTPQ